MIGPDGIDYGDGPAKTLKWRKHVEREAPTDPLVAEVMQTLDRGGWNRDLAARIIEIVRAHDAKQKAGE